MLGWMWVVHNPMDGYVVFNYQDNRRQKKEPRLYLKATFGKAICKPTVYQSYNGIAARPKVHRLGCVAHVRRKFFEAQRK
jgi:transposase